MNIKHVFNNYIKAEKHRLSLSLGNCSLETTPLGSGDNGVVYKGRLNGTEVALKFFLFDESTDKDAFLEHFKKEFLRVALLETRKNIAQYVDYDVLRIQDIDIPVLIMKLYKCSLEEYRTVPSPDVFLKLIQFLIDTVQFLHSMGLSHCAIKPRNILIDDHNEFVLTDVVIPQPALRTHSDIAAIGEVLRWYVFGTTETTEPVNSVFKGMSLYDTLIERCLSDKEQERFQSVEEIHAYLDRQKERKPIELMEEFNLICRKNFPKELPEFVHCADQKKIGKLFADFVARKDFFGNNLVYFTDVERKIFSPQPIKSNYYKFDNAAEFKVLDIWIHCDKEMKNDYILVHHANTQPEKVNGKDTYKWAIYDNKTLITWAEAMNGFAEFEGDIVPLDKNKVEFFERIPREGYLFICLNHHHSLAHPANNGTLRDYFFRFSFNYVNRYILEDMNHTTRHQLKRTTVLAK